MTQGELAIGRLWELAGGGELSVSNRETIQKSLHLQPLKSNA